VILKASQRGGAKQLGLHLLKTSENEHVEIHEVRGFIADDVMDAFAEAYAISRGTKCRQFLFSVSLNPPESEQVRVEVFEEALAKIEERTGLTGQPRIVVFHEKEGRRHAHAVWSRIDAESMTAVQLSHFKLKLRDISKQLYLDHGWKMPRGLMDYKERDPRNFSLDKWQQARRHGLNAKDLKATIQECWAVSDSRASFAQALEERGMYLAQGDRRGHVAVTYDGTVHSIPRMIDKKAKDVTARLGKPDDLPTVETAKLFIAEQVKPKLDGFITQARAEFAKDMAALGGARLRMKAVHDAARRMLDQEQAQRQEAEAKARAERFRKGLKGLWDRLRGQHSKIKKQNEMELFWSQQRDREQRDRLVFDQLAERQLLQQRIRDARKAQAERLRGLHADLVRVRDTLRTAPALSPSQQDMLNRLRQGRKTKDRSHELEL
jgi:hypothetical protein